MTLNDRLEFSLEAQLESLADCRAYIDQKGQALGVDGPLLGDLRLVVDEAVTNIILHAYRGEGGPVELQLFRDGDDIVVLIRDQGPAFDPDGVAEPALDTALAERVPGGMGIFLMRQMMDEVTFTPQPEGGNELRLVKHLDS
jgi:anti-sigma regulatory factor (Ser/Thr protein kinase)